MKMPILSKNGFCYRKIKIKTFLLKKEQNTFIFVKRNAKIKRTAIYCFFQRMFLLQEKNFTTCLFISVVFHLKKYAYCILLYKRNTMRETVFFMSIVSPFTGEISSFIKGKNVLFNIC